MQKARMNIPLDQIPKKVEALLVGAWYLAEQEKKLSNVSTWLCLSFSWHLALKRCRARYMASTLGIVE